MSEQPQRWEPMSEYGLAKMHPRSKGRYVRYADALAWVQREVAEVGRKWRAYTLADDEDSGAYVYRAGYEQGQRDERNRIGRALEQAPYPRGGLLKVEVLNLIYPQDDSRYTTVHGGVQVPDTTPHPDDHPAAGCVHCQDLAADADDLAREIDREEGR